MSKRLHVEPWLSDVELLAWTQEASSRQEYQRRLTVWLARLEPWPAHRIARTLGVSEPAIWKWLGEYNRQGPGGLDRRGRGGRRWGFLALEDEAALLAQVREEASRGGVLTAKHLLPRLRKAVGHEVSLDYVYAVLKRHGWRKLSPRPTHVQGDPAAREAFKKAPQIVAEALSQVPPRFRGMPVRLLFEDEGRFGRISDHRRCWMPLPQRPVVGQQVVREYLYSFVALCPFDGQMSVLTLPWADTTTMSLFLEHTAREFAGQFCLMFVDGAGWHVARELRVPPTVRLLPLPPYSPELNPVEHVWEDLRENDFRNDVLESLDAVADRLGQGIRRLAADPLHVQRLTGFDWIKTIRMTAN